MSRIIISILLIVVFLQGCAISKKTSVFDRSLPDEGVCKFVTFDSVTHLFKPAVPELGSFIPDINVTCYKKTKYSISLDCYVSYRRFIGIIDSTENFEIREMFYNQGYIVYQCDKETIGDRIRFVPRNIIATNKSNFTIDFKRKAESYLVLYIPKLAIGRIYFTSNVYMKFN